ncbi:hypothetical protein BURK1_00072 [Burkholderiales bacterium]|nr:hypothetical protein BURK1_00072 [Burkholderiales bacterium]
MRSTCMLCLIAPALLALPHAAAADFPSRPIRMVVAAPPGSGLDLTVRTLAERMHTDLGTPVIVENRPGADGIIAAQHVAAAPPDGHVLLAASPAQMTINPVLRDRLPYDPARDFVPVSMISHVPLVVVVNPAVPATSVGELAALSNARRGQLDYGSGSSTFMFATELFARRSGADLRHVPYNGVPPVVAALLAGDVQVGLVNLPPAIAHIRAGRLRALAVTGSAREATLPDVPTLAEAGVTRYEFAVWVGAFAPAGTPADVVATLNAAIAKALDAPEVRDRLVDAGIVPVKSSPEELAETVRRERALVQAVASSAGIGAK